MFEKEKVIRLIKKDAFLNHAFTLLVSGGKSEERAAKLVFQTLIQKDGAMLSMYRKAQ